MKNVLLNLQNINKIYGDGDKSVKVLNDEIGRAHV